MSIPDFLPSWVDTDILTAAPAAEQFNGGDGQTRFTNSNRRIGGKTSRARTSPLHGDGARTRARIKHRTGTGFKVTGEPVDGDPNEGLRRAKSVALRYLGSCARTEHQIRGALVSRGYSGDLQDQVIAWLNEHGLIDDTQFAKDWVVARARGRALAPRALAHEMKRKGLGETEIEIGLQGFDAVAVEQEILRILARKANGVNLSDRPTREKLQRRLLGMLQRKGHSMGTAQRLIIQALDEAESN